MPTMVRKKFHWVKPHSTYGRSLSKTYIVYVREKFVSLICLIFYLFFMLLQVCLNLCFHHYLQLSCLISTWWSSTWGFQFLYMFLYINVFFCYCGLTSLNALHVLLFPSLLSGFLLPCAKLWHPLHHMLTRH